MHLGKLNNILRHGVLNNIDISGLGISSKEMKWQGTTKGKVQRSQELELHLSDVSSSEGIVCDVHKVVDLRGIHLLHLAGSEHGGYS